ncbi:MAG: PAS domain-containing protein [Kiloniellales bacterium]
MSTCARGVAARFDPAAIGLPVTRALYAYWAGKRRAGGLPCRRDIDPTEIPRLLSNVMLLDVEEKPLRFRFRLVGNNVVSWFGCNATGLYTDSAEYRRGGPDPSGDYREVVEAREPRVYRKRLDYLLPEFRDFERLVLPLADGGRIDRLICAVDVVPFDSRLSA